MLKYIQRGIMNKGISFYWGFNIPAEERCKILKQIGFDCIITNADKKFDKQNSSIYKQIRLLKKHNLKLSSLHMRYTPGKLPYFWTKSLKGYLMEKRLLNDIKYAKKFGFSCVVVHVKGKPNDTGLQRIERALKLCSKLNIDLAIENTENIACFTYIFDNIHHKHLKFCYDSGHHHCFHPEIDYLSLYGDKLVCLHLHDNMGDNDSHTLNKYGNIDWDDVAKKLASIDFNGNLDYELLCPTGDENCEEVAHEVYRQACELEEKITRYKK